MNPIELVLHNPHLLLIAIPISIIGIAFMIYHTKHYDEDPLGIYDPVSPYGF